MNSVLAGCLGLYAVIVVIATVADGLTSMIEHDTYVLMTPISLHKNTRMNWFGCILTWIAFGLISPIVFVFKLFYFLFHL